MYAITATVETRVQVDRFQTVWRGSRQVPTFYLDEATQGITGPNHAVSIARQIIDPLGEIPPSRIHVHAVKLPEGK